MILNISIVNKSNNPLPSYATQGSSGVDLRANYVSDGIEYSFILDPGKRVLVPTGLFVAIPEGLEWQIRPRSGLAYKHGITVLNSPGTIDSDYRGEVKILLINNSDEPFLIQHGERIAQAVLAKVEIAEYDEVNSVEDLDSTERGDGGFGSTGKK